MPNEIFYISWGVPTWRNKEIIFPTEFGKIVCILADFGKQVYYRTRAFRILKDGVRQNSSAADR